MTTLATAAAEAVRPRFFPVIAVIAGLLLTVPAVSRAQQDQSLQLRERRESLVERDNPRSAVPARRIQYKVNILGQNRRPKTQSVTPTCSSPKLSYFGGPVISNIQPIAVFWSQHVNPELIQPTTGVAQFLADLGNSTYMSAMHEYGSYGTQSSGMSSEQWIGNGSSTPESYTLIPSKCGGTASCTLQDSDIQSELNAQIAAGNLPAPTYDTLGNPNTVYMTYFPPNVAVNLEGSLSCQVFCAYHNTGTYSANGEPLIYGVLMDQFTTACTEGCGANSTAMENETSVSSHEFAEAITDADIGLDTGSGYTYPAGWGDNNNDCGEIADICDTNAAGDSITVDGRNWTVQELWSNKQAKCTSTGSTNNPFNLSATSPENQGTQFSTTLTALTIAGTTNFNYNGTVHFTSSDSAAVLPADFTFTNSNGGVTTFNATLKTPGTQTITVTDIENGDLTASESITVNSVQVAVPNVVGDTEAAAQTAITGAGLVLGTVTQQASKTVPSGEVISQNPTSGTNVNSGSSVNLVISSGATPASLTSPTGGSVLTGPSETFTWTTESGATGYALRLGTTVGGNNIWSSGPITANSAMANGLPTNGETVYGRLYTNYGSFEVYTDYTFTAATAAALTSPTGGSVLTGPSETFNWTTASGATGYALRVGTTVGGNNIWSSGTITTTSTTAKSLPTNGHTVYVRLYTYYGSANGYVDYTFTAATQAALTSPTGGSVLTGPSETFNWSTAAGATGYALRLGTTVGGNNIWSSGPITATSATAKNLPTNGETVYARLYTTYGSTQAYTDYTFTAATSAALTSPTGGSVLAGPSVTFNWTTASGATGYALRAGTTLGGNNIWSSGTITTTSITAKSLPTNGETVYVRLYTYYGSANGYADYTFTAATQAALTSPTGGSVLIAPNQTFNWTTAAGATGYALRLGTSVGGNDIWSSGPITATSATAKNLPTNGETVYARLYTTYGSTQVYTDYTYTAYTAP